MYTREQDCAELGIVVRVRSDRAGRLNSSVVWSVEDIVVDGILLPCRAGLLQLAAVVDLDAFEVLNDLEGEAHGVVLVLLVHCNAAVEI